MNEVESRRLRWSTQQCEALHAELLRVLDGDASKRADTVRALCLQELGAPPAQVDADAPAGAHFVDDPHAEVAFMALVVAACVRADGLQATVVDRVSAFGEAAGVDPLWRKVLRRMAAGQGRRITMLLARQAPDGKQVLAHLKRKHGLLAPLRILQTMTGSTPAEPELGWWFKQLGLLPAGTVGRAFWENMTRRKIMLPGEPGGMPEAAVHHDLMHTLGDYDTDPAGECEIGGFYAGTLVPGWPAWIFAGLATFELALRVGPEFTVPTRGAFDVARVFAAAKRAYRARESTGFHPMGAWDYRPLMSLTLDQARTQLGL